MRATWIYHQCFDLCWLGMAWIVIVPVNVGVELIETYSYRHYVFSSTTTYKIIKRKDNLLSQPFYTRSEKSPMTINLLYLGHPVSWGIRLTWHSCLACLQHPESHLQDLDFILHHNVFFSLFKSQARNMNDHPKAYFRYSHCHFLTNIRIFYSALRMGRCTTLANYKINLM